jgi:hypothetical protein
VEVSGSVSLMVFVTKNSDSQKLMFLTIPPDETPHRDSLFWQFRLVARVYSEGTVAVLKDRAWISSGRILAPTAGSRYPEESFTDFLIVGLSGPDALLKGEQARTERTCGLTASR